VLALAAATFAWLWRAEVRLRQGVELSLQLVAEELELQNRRLAEQTVSAIRGEAERGQLRNVPLVARVYALRAAADSACLPHHLADPTAQRVQQFTAWADSLQRVWQMDDDPFFAAFQPGRHSPLERRVHVRLVERSGLQALAVQPVRLTRVADTLSLLAVPYSFTVEEGTAFEALLLPYWSASGFHPFEQYTFKASLGTVEDTDEGNRGRLRIPTTNWLEPGEEEHWVEYRVECRLTGLTVARRAPAVLQGRFRVVPPCRR
jgi:hypothetical protein